MYSIYCPKGFSLNILIVQFSSSPLILTYRSSKHGAIFASASPWQTPEAVALLRALFCTSAARGAAFGAPIFGPRWCCFGPALARHLPLLSFASSPCYLLLGRSYPLSAFVCCLLLLRISPSIVPFCLLLVCLLASIIRFCPAAAILLQLLLYSSKSVSIQVHIHSFSSSKPCMSTISLSVSQYLLFILWLAESRRFS